MTSTFRRAPRGGAETAPRAAAGARDKKTCMDELVELLEESEDLDQELFDQLAELEQDYEALQLKHKEDLEALDEANDEVERLEAEVAELKAGLEAAKAAGPEKLKALAGKLAECNNALSKAKEISDEKNTQCKTTLSYMEDVSIVVSQIDQHAVASLHSSGCGCTSSYSASRSSK